jgi:membrane protein YqaA with SNARE-associated domain
MRSWTNVQIWKNWLGNASDKKLLGGIGFLAILESTILPFIIELVLVPAMLWRQKLIWPLAVAAAFGNVIGCILGYATGYFFFETGGQWLVEQFGWQEQLNEVQTKFADEGVWYIFFIALSLVPLQVGTLGAGVVQLPFLPFLAAVVAARSIRYVFLAVLAQLLGERIQPLLRKYQKEFLWGWTGFAALCVVYITVW